MGGAKQKKPGKRGKFKGRDALRHENRQIRAIVTKLGLNKEEQRELHETVTGQDLSFVKIMQWARELFGGKEQ